MNFIKNNLLFPDHDMGFVKSHTHIFVRPLCLSTGLK
jgi:hypothetical protein